MTTDDHDLKSVIDELQEAITRWRNGSTESETADFYIDELDEAADQVARSLGD